jgi:histidine ammonia-lyase
MAARFLLKPSRLTLGDLRRFQGERPRVVLAEAVRSRMRRSRAVVDRRIRDRHPTYGINTGFGSLSGRSISPEDLAELQRRLLTSNAAGTGPLMAPDDVRRMMLLKVNALASGLSGVRPQLATALLAMLNAGVLPCVPVKGSVGASGDLAPLAHMGAALIGEGDVMLGGRIMPARAGLRRAGINPFELAAKEGLAIVNGTQASTALAVGGLFASENVFAAAIVAGALSVEAALGQTGAFDPRLHAARGQPGQIATAAAYARLLRGSAVRRIARREGRLQDPYCLRCQPQVMGACLDQLNHGAAVLRREINAWTDNPMIAPDGEVIYGGNFHAEPIGFAADGMALALAEIGAMSERRIAMLTDAHHSLLPAFLIAGGDLDSGFMVAQVTAAALASENKLLAHPATADSIPTTANHEDFVSMATFAARRLEDMADNSAGIVAIELLAACQGLEFRRPVRSSKALESAVDLVRARVPRYEQDRFFAPDIAAVKQLVRDGHFLPWLSADLRFCA